MVNVSWHPNRATCAVSVGRSVYLVDGATGAVLRVARTPLATLALAYAPAKLGARLCALLRDGSLHAVDFEDETRTAADAARSGMNRGGGGGGGAPGFGNFSGGGPGGGGFGGGQQPTSENRFTEEDAAPHRPATVDEVD